MTTRRAAYLRAMGIVPWVRRVREGAQAPGTEPGRDAGGREPWVLQQADAPVAVVVVAWPDRSLVPGAGEAGRLLVRVLEALEQPLERFTILGWSSGDRPPEAAGRPVFCFADSVPRGSEWVALPSLSRMLSDGRPAKVQAWKVLRPWISRLGQG